MFEGFTDETVRFFMDLRFHNSKAFMDANRDRYIREVRERFYDLIFDLGPHMLRIDPDMEVRPHKVLSRINRDTRFSKDKSPYRDHLWMAFRPEGMDKDRSPFYWFEFGPDSIDWGVGLWGESRSAMDTLRMRMAARPENYLPVADALQKAGFVTQGASWKKLAVPGNIPASLRDIYVKRSIYFSKARSDYDLAFSEKLTRRLARDYKTVQPVWRMLRGLEDPKPPDI